MRRCCLNRHFLHFLWFCTFQEHHFVLYFIYDLYNAFNPFSNDKILDFSKQKEFADDNFTFYENGRKSSIQEGNTVGKEEIAHNKAISPFPTEFSKELYCRHVKTRPCLGEG